MNSFQSMSLADSLKKALNDLNFINPTGIQESVIPVSISGKDIVACAETGSGKTGAFVIPMVSRLLESPHDQALILAPTRELAQQIFEFIQSATKYCKGFHVTCLLGGSDIQRQFRSLKKQPRVIVATPGRLNDHLNRRTANLKNTRILILDEGDRMLDMGFAPQLDQVIKHLPKKRQTSLFSATMPDKVKKMAKSYLTSPTQIGAERVAKPVSQIKQSVIEVTDATKLDRLIDELNARSGSIIIFARTKRSTNKICLELNDFGFAVDMIHGDRTQGQRNRAIKAFKTGKSRILVATDIAARGIDIPEVEHVINYDLPTMIEDYVHRVGRTARNGATGDALSFVTPSDHYAWKRIAKKYNIKGVELQGTPSKTQGPQRKKRGKGGGGGGKRRSPSRRGQSAASSEGASDKKKSATSKKSNKKFKSKSKSGSNKKNQTKSKTRSKHEASAKSKSKSSKKFGSKKSSKSTGRRQNKTGFKKKRR